MNCSDVFVIAEAGSNHNGSVGDAIKLIDIACAAGADSVKFQFIFAEGLYLPQFLDDGQYLPSLVYQQRQREELTDEEWAVIWEHANKRGIDISASVFCSRGVELLKKLGASYVKIASTDLTNHSLISAACESFPRVILSTGMASLGEVAMAVQAAFRANSGIDLKLMHCVSLYPCDFTDAKVSRISALKSAFEIDVGYSDHTEEEYSALLAWSKGARLFEKHFTYDRSLPGFDHANASSPSELENYIKVLKQCESASCWSEVGDNHQGREAVTKVRARRALYAAKDLPAGHILTEEDILYVRPSSVFQCNNPAEVIGHKLESNVPKYGAIGLVGEARLVESNSAAALSYWHSEMKQKKMVSDGQ